MEEKKNLSQALKKEAVRIVIEHLQRIQADYRQELPEKRDGEYEVELLSDNAYMNRSGVPLAMDIVKPVTDGAAELPVLVLIHGGALIVGDRRMSRGFSVMAARRGYLVFSIEYRMAPNANVCEQMDDVCAGMDYIGKRLVEFNVDFTRVFLAAESAGACLAIYAAAMKRSEQLQKVIGHEPSRMTFQAVGLISGMFYTERNDPLGIFMKDQYYGSRAIDPVFKQYMDPEHPEIIRNLPPCWFTTSRGDFLNRYTLMYHEAVKKAGIPTRLKYYGSDELIHAFMTMMPTREESRDALTDMLNWFEEQAQRSREEAHIREEEAEARKKLLERVSSREITRQKAWKYIREMNSWSRDRLNTRAMIDGRKEYTYAQMFHIWERYAAAFSGLEISERSHSRVGLIAIPAIEAAFSLYGLNMVGASVSTISPMEVFQREAFSETLKAEKITDLLLADNCTTEQMLVWLLKEKKQLGLRHIIVLHTPVGGITVSTMVKEAFRVNAQLLRRVPGALHMTDLIREYRDTPIAWAETESDENAFIVHTSGTTKGIRKPIPLSDTAINSAVNQIMDLEVMQKYEGHGIMNQLLDLSAAYGLVDQTHLPLAMGLTKAVIPLGPVSPGYYKGIEMLHVNVMYTGVVELEKMAHSYEKDPFDWSGMELVLTGGFYLSPDMKKRMKDQFRLYGAEPQILIGYGLSELAGVCVMTEQESMDDVLGFPLPDMDILIRDENDQKDYRIEDGERIGTLLLSSASMTTGKIDGEKYIDLEVIDGKKWICTWDMVRVNGDGSLTYMGRTNRFFLSSTGIRFDAGLIERALSAVPDITACAIVPEFNKVVHDTLPALYVKTPLTGAEETETVRNALLRVFASDGAAKQTNLPCRCVITDDLPYNANGKVDIHQIAKRFIPGRRYAVIPAEEEGAITDIRLEPLNEKDSAQQIASLPAELRAGFNGAIMALMA